MERFLTDADVLYENSQQGWICPNCGAAVSPKEKVCPVCSKKVESKSMQYTMPDSSSGSSTMIFE